VKLPPVVHEISVEFVVIKQNKAPVHRACETARVSKSSGMGDIRGSSVKTCDPNSRDLTDKNSGRTTVASRLTEMNDVDERKQCPVNV